MKPVTEAHYKFIFELSTESATAYRWRFRGAIPSPAEFIRVLWSGILAQFAVYPLGDQSAGPIGLVQLYNADFKNRYAYLAMLLSGPAQKLAWPIEAGGLLVNYAFNLWDFRKLYAEAPDVNYVEVASGSSGLFKVEGTLSDHEYIAGSYRDTTVLSISRSTWELQRTRMEGLGYSFDYSN